MQLKLSHPSKAIPPRRQTLIKRV